MRTIREKIVLVLVITTAALVISSTTSAQMIYVPIEHPRRPHRPFLSIKSQQVQVTIDNQAATTVIKQVFANESRRDLEGTYIFPIPRGASIRDFSMWMNGKKVTGRLLDADKARQIYIDIVRRMRDPGLLEYAGQGMFKARVYPIPAYGEVKIEISYEELLGYDAGLISYRYPLGATKFGKKKIGEVAVSVEIASNVRIKSIYSPSHEIDLTIQGETAHCGYEEREVIPDRDFILYYTVSEQEMGLSLLTHKTRGEDGYFLLLASPGRLETREDVIEKDVIFVLDTSGSMKGRKINQAKRALRYCLRRMNEGDRFNIITFATGTESFKEELVPWTKKHLNRALDFIDWIEARGGTNIDRALKEALAAPDARNPQMIILLTDGAPTAGETDDDDILANVNKRNEGSFRIFTFGVGYDVNTYLLDNLSLGNGGMVEYVKPEESIEEKVTSFFSKVSEPVMTDVSITFHDMRVRDLYPADLPDIFNGMQLVLFGRYEGSGSSSIVLRGRTGDSDTKFRYEGRFDARNSENEFIPRLWATRKIAYLLTEIRKHGEDDELVDEIVSLANEHGIITPYTSYLITERGPRKIVERITSALRFDEHRAVEPAFTAKKGKEAFDLSHEAARGRGEDVLQSSHSENLRYVGEKTFYLSDGTWIDAAYEEGAPVLKVEYLSTEYLQLLNDVPEMGKYLSLGPNIIVVFRGTNYQITE